MYGPERIQLIFKHCDLAEDTQNDLASNAHMERETYQVAAQRLRESFATAETKVSHMI